MINCVSIIFFRIVLVDLSLKYTLPHKVPMCSLISQMTQVFKPVLKRPALRNLLLTVLASTRVNAFQINTLAAKLPVAVRHYKTKQKRLLRFINSCFPTDVALDAWCAFVLCSLRKAGRQLRILLVDETDILQDYRVIVIAAPFRKRAIPIYWQIYRKDSFDKMVFRSHNVLVQEFCKAFVQQFEKTLPG
ncbi:hypothetical protein C6497_08855, partial [Candidatus Poribacteria bacterium]